MALLIFLLMDVSVPKKSLKSRLPPLKELDHLFVIDTPKPDTSFLVSVFFHQTGKERGGVFYIYFSPQEGRSFEGRALIRGFKISMLKSRYWTSNWHWVSDTEGDTCKTRVLGTMTKWYFFTSYSFWERTPFFDAIRSMNGFIYCSSASTADMLQDFPFGL